MAIGTVAAVSGDRAIGIGKSVLSSGTGSIAIGSDKTTGNSDYYGDGENTQATATDSIALGRKARATHENALALGAGSATEDKSKNLSYAFANDSGTTVNPKDQNNQGSVLSVGNASHKRQIVNVAQGRVTAESTDAVNGSQLYDVVKNTGFNVAGNDGKAKSRINNNGIVKFMHSEGDDELIQSDVKDDGDNAIVRFKVKTKAITSTKQGEAIATGTGLAKSSEVVTAINNSGFHLTANGESDSFIANNGTVDIAQGKNIVVAKKNNQITIKTEDDVTFTNVTSTKLNVSGPATFGGATTFTGAATFNNAINANGGFTAGAGTTINMGGNIISGVKAGEQPTDAVNRKQLDDAVANAGGSWQLGANSETNLATVNKTNNVVRVIKGTNIDVSRSGNNITVKTVDAPTFAGKVTAQGGLDAGGNKITNVGAGDVSATSKDAVNGAQLNTVKEAAATADAKAVAADAKADAAKTAAANADAKAVAADNKAQAVQNEVNKGWSLTASKSTGGNLAGVRTDKINMGETVTIDAGKNVNITQSENKISIAVNDTPTFTSVNTGDLTATGNTTIGGNGKNFTVAGGTIVNMSNNKITGLGDATDNSDAVNKGQLDAAVDKAVKDAVKSASGNWLLGINNQTDAEATNVNSTANIVRIKQGDNVVVTKEANNITVAVSQNPTFTTLNTTGDATVGGKLTAKNGIDANSKQITNVSNGGVNATSTNAVNGAEVYKAVNDAKTDLTDTLINKGLKFSGNSGVEVNRTLGSTMQIVGTGKQADEQYDASNVKTVATQDGGIEIRIDKNPTFANLTTTGNLSVAGNSTISGNQTVEKDLTVNGTTNLNGDTHIGGNQTVAGNSTIAGNQTIAKNLTVNGDTNLNGNTTIGGEGKTFNVAGNTTVNMGGNTITNVGDAKNDTDAVNKGQVEKWISTATKELTDGGLTFNGNTGSTTQKLGTTLNIVGGNGAGSFSTNNVRTKATENTVTIEISDKPTFTDLTTTGNVTVNGNQTVAGNSTISGNQTVEKDLTVNGTTNLNGDTHIGGNQTVAGNSTISGNQTVEKDLTVNGTTNLNGDTHIGGNQTVAGNSTIAGNQTVEKDLTVNGTTNLNGDTHIGGNQTVAGNSTIAGNQTIAKNLTVNGDTNLNGNTTIGGEGKTFNIAGNTTVNMGGNTITNIGDAKNDTDAVNKGQVEKWISTATKELTDGGLTFNGDTGSTKQKLGTTLNIVGGNGTGPFSTKNVRTNATTDKVTIEISDKPTFTDLTTTGNVTVGGNQTVAGNSTISGNQTVEKDLTVNGTTNLNGDTHIGGNQTVAGNSIINGDQAVDGNQTVMGDSTTVGNQTVVGNSYIGGNQTVEKDLTVNGTT
ncbi:beta strand repeat-containing protein, partial [Pasteurellaceae bacterium 22721_9_1]